MEVCTDTECTIHLSISQLYTIKVMLQLACSLFSFLSHLCSSRLLSVLCCNLDSFLLLESQYNLPELLLQGQKDNVTEPPSGEG